MSRIAQAQVLASKGAVPEAVQSLETGGSSGDGNCWAELAMWYLQARFVPRNLARSRECFGLAGALGNGQARMIHLSLVTNGTGGPPDWAEGLAMLRGAAADDPDAARQADLIDLMKLDKLGDPLELLAGETLSDRPYVAQFPALFTEAECRYLTDSASKLYRPAPVGHVAGGGLSVSDVRTCDAAGFPWILENPVIHALNRRIAAASRTRVEWGEPLQVFRYRHGQEFKPHRDCTEATDNQRVLTMLVYLNGKYTGGETQFFESGLKVRGTAGAGLLFRNADDQGVPDPASLHAGLPVTNGEKLVASRWIRQKAFGPIT